MYIVSGSNMSGKSTFLRTIGVNTVLAYTGCSVRADSMTLSMFSLGSSLKVSDSLLSGVSKFYAEISRIKIILSLTELTEAPPLLFLVDEIFQGTNSHDRQQGAQAVFVEMVKRKGCGLVTTHDLALSNIPETYAKAMVNVHFTDTFKDGEIKFNYTLQNGVVTKSNAIELMRSVGLPV
jgi:DNA mismatch repair ATPase MutS